MANESVSSSEEVKRVMIAAERDNHETTHILTDSLPRLKDKQIRLRVDKVGLSANNKFYLGFGEDKIFHFFAAYPVPDDLKETEGKKKLINMPAWGIGTVVESTVEGVYVGEKFRGFYHMSTFVQHYAKATKDGFIVENNNGFHPAYRPFQKITTSSPLGSSNGTISDVAMTTWPGFITGFCLSEYLKINFFGAASIAFTSASSKVALAAAFFLQQARQSKKIDFQKIVGFTSDCNKDFVKSTGLYDVVLGYNEELLPAFSTSTAGKAEYILVDIAGQGSVYGSNQSKVIKALVVGNAQNIPDTESSFKHFSMFSTLKMMMVFMGVPRFVRNLINPKVDLFLVLDTITDLQQNSSEEEFGKALEAAMNDFVGTLVTKKWLEVRRCETFDSIQSSYRDICKGTVKPSEAVILDIGKAAE